MTDSSLASSEQQQAASVCRPTTRVAADYTLTKNTSDPERGVFIPNNIRMLTYKLPTHTALSLTHGSGCGFDWISPPSGTQVL